MNEPRVGPPLEDVTVVEVEGRISIYNPRTEEVVSLNGTASAVWSLSTGDLSLNQIVEALAQTYSISAHDIRPDVVSAVDRLLAHGLIRVR